MRLNSYRILENVILAHLHTRDKIDLTLLKQQSTTWRILRSMQLGNLLSVMIFTLIIITYAMYYISEKSDIGTIGAITIISIPMIFMALIIIVTAKFVNLSYRRVCYTMFSLFYITK
jgi:hypothetical protein